MTRPVQRLLALVLVAAPIAFMGCGADSSSKQDAAPKDSRPPDVAIVPKPDASPDLTPVVPPDALPVTFDVANELLVAPPDAGLGTTPDVLADTITPVGDVGPAPLPDAAVDGIPPIADAGPVLTPDAAADASAAPGDAGPALDGGEAGPIVTTDANADGGTATDGNSAADGAGAGPDSTRVACGTFVGGIITSNLTLTKECSPYVISDFIAVNTGAVLTIEPGVTLRFTGTAGIDVGGDGDGQLVAVGTAADPIVFTSDANPPLPGDWRSIHLFDGTMTGTKIAHAKLDYCGADHSGCIIGDGVATNHVTLDHVTIGHVSPDAHGILEYDSDSNFAITNSTFSDIDPSRYAISLQAPSFAGIGAGNVFNGNAMIEIFGGILGTTTSWVDPGTDIAVTDSLYVDGVDNPVLTLGPGMTLKFNPVTPPLEFSIGSTMGGKLVVAGTSTNRVTVTSLADAPNQGDWVGIEVWALGAAQISYANISYGGSDGSGGGDIILEGANSTSSLAVDHTAMTFSMGYGIYLACSTPGATPVATVTLGAGNTYAYNDMDLSLSNTQSSNVGPGVLPGLACSAH